MQWLTPWIVVDDERNRQAWKQELQRECPYGHVLFGYDAEFIARGQDRDDFLIELEDKRVALVHLTWSVEQDPRWPASEIYASLSDWVERVMLADHAEWED